jgi:hypothetical protein
MTPPARRVLGLFAKWPVPGSVKTRLAAGRSAEWAAQVATAFLCDTVDRLATVQASRILAFAPPDAEPAFESILCGRFDLVPQGEGDLGQRMTRFFADRLAAGAERVVLVGMDSPTLPLVLVEQAFQELDHADVVLGPATDGGYYLVGCGGRLPPIFDGVAWSSNHTLADTIARLTDRTWRLALLPPWYDVDTMDDWQMLRGHQAAMRRAGFDPGIPRTAALLKAETT